MEVVKKYSCICGKSYNHLQNLSVHRKKCQEYQSQKNQKENISITIEEIDESNKSKDEINSLKEMILKLQNENKELQLKLQHKDEIIEILKKMPVANSNQSLFNLDNYLNNCNEVKSIYELKKLIKNEIKDLDLHSLKDCFNNKGDISKIYILKLQEFMKKIKNIIPIRCSDTKRKTIYAYYFKEDDNDPHNKSYNSRENQNEKWIQIDYDEYVKLIRQFSGEIQKNLKKLIVETYEKNKINNDEFSSYGFTYEKSKLERCLFNDRNNEYIANKLLQIFKIEK
jgi:hypothetical protein